MGSINWNYDDPQLDGGCGGKKEEEDAALQGKCKRRYEDEAPEYFAEKAYNYAPNPTYQGIRIVNRDDMFPKGFDAIALDTAYAGLVEDPHEEGLLLESPTLEEVDDYYNPGVEAVSDAYVLEAITVEHFSRTEKRMAAVVRVFNRHLSDSEINALPPVVGKPKKQSGFAYVVVQLPFSDGQTVNVVFHSPEGDKKKIMPTDTIVAFRWLLNKRDITHLVAPEEGEEVSLETIAKRVTQLVQKNSARFERQQKEAKAERQELADMVQAVKDAETKQSEALDAVAAQGKELDTLEAKISNTLAKVEKAKTRNAELMQQIATLQQTNEHRAAAAAAPDPTPEPTPAPETPPASAQKGGEDIDKKFAEMVDTAARWRGAAMNKDKELVGNKKAMNELNRMTTKGDLDAYLMRKFGISETEARDVSNYLTQMAIKPNMDATPDEFADEPWAKLTTDYTPDSPQPKQSATEPQGDTPPAAEPEYMKAINAINAGAFGGNTDDMLKAIEDAVSAAEAEGKLDEYYAAIDAASNVLTEALSNAMKEAA